VTWTVVAFGKPAAAAAASLLLLLLLPSLRSAVKNAGAYFT